MLEYKGYPVVYFEDEPSDLFTYKGKVNLTKEQIDIALSDWRCDCDLGIRDDFDVFSYYLKDLDWIETSNVNGYSVLIFKEDSKYSKEGVVFKDVRGRDKLLILSKQL